MNCQMGAWVYTDDPAAQAALQAVAAWMEQVEQALSRFRPGNDLSRLNAAAGRPYQAGDILWEVTGRAVEAAAESDGVFDPTIGQALLDAGYDRSFEQLDRVVTQEAMVAPDSRPIAANHSQEIPDYRSIRLDRAGRTITLPPGTRLDLGGIAKGWAAERALEILRPFGPAMIDAGGDLAIGDPPPGETGWPIAVADPLSPDQDLVLLSLANTGVATSGADHRRWRHHGRQHHHLIDPFSRRSAQTDILNATVLAPTATQADIIALMLMILGLEAGQQWLQRHSSIPALLVLNDGRTYQTPTFAFYVQTYFPLYA